MQHFKAKIAFGLVSWSACVGGALSRSVVGRCMHGLHGTAALQRANARHEPASRPRLSAYNSSQLYRRVGTQMRARFWGTATRE